MENTTTAKLYDLERRVKALEDRLHRETWQKASVEDDMVAQFGAYVNKSEAAQILGVCRATIYFMLGDGRLEGAMEGRKVSVRSIARYLMASKKRGGSNAR